MALWWRASSNNFWRIKELQIDQHPHLHLIEFDLTDSSSAMHLLSKVQPDEIYNLAAQSFVGTSFSQPMTTSHITALGVLNLLKQLE